MSRSHQRRMKNLMKNPYCFWCGIKVKKYVGPDRLPYPDDMATIDHLYSRFDIRRYICRNKTITVLACNKCNGERERQEHQQLSKEEKAFRSKNQGKLISNITISLN